MRRQQTEPLQDRIASFARGSERKPLSFHLVKRKTTCSGEPGWPIWRPIWTIGPPPACSRQSKAASDGLIYLR
jgi:hypothetical protein